MNGLRNITVMVLWAALLCSGERAFASAESLKDGIAAFDRADFGTASAFFQGYLKQHPTDSVAHYYLANCYAKVNKPALTIIEYQACIELNNNPKVVASARKALAVLQPGPAGSAARVDDYAEKIDKALKDEERLTKLVDRLMKKHEAYLTRRKLETNEACDRLTARAEDDIKQIPTNVPFGIGVIKNPEYDSEVLVIRRAVDYKINKMKQDLAHDEQRLRDLETQNARRMLSKQAPQFQSY